MTEKRREGWELIRDILDAVGGASSHEIRKTIAMRRANLDFRTFERYFRECLNAGFITARVERAGQVKRIFLSITEAGEMVRKGINKLQEDMKRREK